MKLYETDLPSFYILSVAFEIILIRFQELKMNKTQSFQRALDFLQVNSSISSNNRQSLIDQQFERSATPVFITMLSLSVATFIAAFFQVYYERNRSALLEIFSTI